jgi:intraflagellar transport protein 56
LSSPFSPQLQSGKRDIKKLQWLAYSQFHLGEYQKALDVYRELQKLTQDAREKNLFHLYAASCLLYLGQPADAEKEAQYAPDDEPLKARLMFHIAFKQNDESKLVQNHQKLSTSVEDRLTLASFHFMQGSHQEATDIYKERFLDNREHSALQVYIAMCYYALDFFEESLGMLAPYFEKNPDSVMAANLKACNHYRLYDGKAAEAELKHILDVLASSSQNAEDDLLQHNLVVFRGGENSQTVLPPLIDAIPEARLNLAVCHLRNNEFTEAHELMKDIKPSTVQQYILKAATSAAVGQANGSAEHLQTAHQLFQLVGSSKSECDTIPGRQSMASCYILCKQWDDVLVYLDSIAPYSQADPTFWYNLGLAQASVGKYAEAEQALLNVQDERLRDEYVYVSWLTRCLIKGGKAEEAWEMYQNWSSQDSVNLLILIANECYQVGSFYYAAKAFDVLERLDPQPIYWDGKRGACCGVFKLVTEQQAPPELLVDIINMLRANATSPQADYIMRTMIKWAEDNHLDAIIGL